jgi:hypothetical protein
MSGPRIFNTMADTVLSLAARPGGDKVSQIHLNSPNSPACPADSGNEPFTVNVATVAFSAFYCGTTAG